MITPLNHLTQSEYRAYEAVSQTDLKKCHENPQLYYEQYVAKTRPVDGPSKSQQWGTTLESVLRGQEEFRVIPSAVLNEQGHRKGNKYVDWAEATRFLHPGVELVKREEVEDFYEAQNNLRFHELANRLIYSPSAQWSRRYTWPCPLTGMQLKGELDLLDVQLETITDVKTADDIDLRTWEGDILRYGYDIQAAMYLEAAALAYPDVDWSYAWVVVRNKAPFNVEVYEASQEYLELGRRRLEHRKLFYHECVQSGRWVTPTHGQICTVYPPRFAKEVV